MSKLRIAGAGCIGQVHMDTPVFANGAVARGEPEPLAWARDGQLGSRITGAIALAARRGRVMSIAAQ
ncbi:MAG: hypothetical protein JWP29_3877 [Rhodoferax sp.]|nr:hypothetical protein [Rhodoferax sp.]